MMYLQSAIRGQHKGHVSAFSACLDDFPGTKRSRAVDSLELLTMEEQRETALKILKVPQHWCRIRPKWRFVLKPGASHRHQRLLLNSPRAAPISSDLRNR